jgi:transcriptional regulator with XRE-family HTH domain
MSTAHRGARSFQAVGARIRTRRAELGLTQREIESDGVSYAYISRIERNTRRPSA